MKDAFGTAKDSQMDEWGSSNEDAWIKTSKAKPYIYNACGSRSDEGQVEQVDTWSSADSWG